MGIACVVAIYLLEEKGRNIFRFLDLQVELLTFFNIVVRSHLYKICINFELLGTTKYLVTGLTGKV